MICRNLFLLFASFPLFVFPVRSQTTDRDPKALQIITKSIDAAGGVQRLTAITDFTGLGDIVYYWGADEESGRVTIKGKGRYQFRLEANLPGGTRTWVVDNGNGSIRQPDGGKREIARHYALNLGNFTFPSLQLLSALQDASKRISYLGVSTCHDHQVHGIRVKDSPNPDTDPAGVLSELRAKTFYIDLNSFEIVAIEDQAHTVDGPSYPHPHEVFFSNYQAVGGISVPFSIGDSIRGTKTFVIQIQQVGFNAKLSDLDFTN
jgi:hypothetical protein